MDRSFRRPTGQPSLASKDEVNKDASQDDHECDQRKPFRASHVPLILTDDRGGLLKFDLITRYRLIGLASGQGLGCYETFGCFWFF